MGESKPRGTGPSSLWVRCPLCWKMKEENKPCLGIAVGIGADSVKLSDQKGGFSPSAGQWWRGQVRAVHLLLKPVRLG